LNWFEHLPLFGQRVVVTRARRQASALCRKLARLGADVLEIPTLRIDPVPLSAGQQERFTSFGRHFDWVIFCSPNGAERFLAELVSQRLDIRVLGPVRIAALGPATAARLEESGLRIDRQPAIFTKDALADLLDREEMAGKRICLVQGNLADPALAEHLQARGAAVEPWTFYETRPETTDLTGHRARFLREGAHFMAFTSASTVDNWQALQLEPAHGAPRPRIVSLGPVTSGRLRELGCPLAAEAEKATLDSLIETIRKLV
jgi:uroporphyrinogen III methyltransferase/synthase